MPSLFCLVPCCSVTRLPCYLVTLLPCYSVPLLLCYSETRSVTLLLLYRLYLHKLYLPFFLGTLLLCYPVTLLPCYPVNTTQGWSSITFVFNHTLSVIETIVENRTTRRNWVQLVYSVQFWIEYYKPVSSIYHFSVQNFLVTSRGQLYKAWRQT